MKVVFEDPTFSFELLRTLGHTYARAADVGECLSTADRIRDGDFDSWYSEWRATAERVHGLAQHSLTRSHRLSAQEAFLRASTYYRAAEFFLHTDPTDARIVDTWRRSVDCFGRAAALFSAPIIEPIRVPYEDTTLPGYRYRVDDSGRPRRTLVFFGGFDSTAEELHQYGAQFATERGWNVITFDGPGQGQVIREQGLPFRPDWEAVVAPVLAYARSLPEVDPDRVALMGMSFGGYLAERASAFVDVAATVVFNGVWSLGEAFQAMVPADAMSLLDDDAAFDAEMRKLMAVVPGLRYLVTQGMYTFGFDGIAPLVRGLEPYTIEPVIHQIRHPTLVLDAEADHFFPGHPRRVYEALRCPKDIALFSTDEGAEEHCQSGAMGRHTQRVFDWLDEIPALAPIRS